MSMRGIVPLVELHDYERYCPASTVLRLLQQLKTVLEGIVAHPTQQLKELLRLIEIAV